MNINNALLDSAVIACASFLAERRKRCLSDKAFSEFCEPIKDKIIYDFLLKSFELVLQENYTVCMEVMVNIYYEEIDRRKLERPVLLTLIVLKSFIVRVLVLDDFDYFFQMTCEICSFETRELMGVICQEQYLETYSEELARLNADVTEVAQGE